MLSGLNSVDTDWSAFNYYIDPVAVITASVSRGKINPIDPLAGTSRWDLNPIDPLAGTSRWDLNPIDPLPGTTRGCVHRE